MRDFPLIKCIANVFKNRIFNALKPAIGAFAPNTVALELYLHIYEQATNFPQFAEEREPHFPVMPATVQVALCAKR